MSLHKGAVKAVTSALVRGAISPAEAAATAELAADTFVRAIETSGFDRAKRLGSAVPAQAGTATCGGDLAADSLQMAGV